MAKPQMLVGADLDPRKPRPAGVATRQRGVMPSDDLVPMQFKMTREFAREFRQAALDHNLKLNALLKVAFQAFKKTTGD